MSTLSTDLRRPSGTLSIFPPSPSAIFNPITTPTSVSSSISSPRRAPLPPSPTHSTYSSSNVPWLDDRSRSNSLDVPRDAPPPPLPGRSERRGPVSPSLGPPSPHRTQGKGGYAGAYDNKLVSSTLSHLPPLPPLSPTPTGNSTTLTNHSRNPHSSSNSHLLPAAVSKASSFINLPSASPRPSFSGQSSSSGVVVLPNGTALPTSNEVHERGGGEPAGIGRSVHETLVHSSASSPWSLLTVHVLPLFAGSPLNTPIEDLNQLCNSHIVATSQRAPPSRIVAVLSSDLRDFIASGMLTLKAKFETLEEAKIVARAAEVWSFFWAQVLPYLEGVFLPFTQVRDLPSTNASSSQAPTVSSPPIPVRHLLLSGFLLHILLPLLSRLIPLITTSADNRAIPPPTAPDLQRILQMSLVLSTQAKYSSLFPLRDANDNSRRDEEIRNHVESLGKAARWRSSAGESPQTRSVQRQSLQRGPSMNQGRHRRRGWRASTKSGQQWGVGQDAARLNSESVQAPEQQWGRPGVDDEDDDDTSTPGQSYAYPRTGESSYATMTTGSTLTAGAMGGESLASYGESQRTPQAEFGMRRPNRSESSGSSEVNLSTVVPARR